MSGNVRVPRYDVADVSGPDDATGRSRVDHCAQLADSGHIYFDDCELGLCGGVMQGYGRLSPDEPACSFSEKWKLAGARFGHSRA